MTKSLFRALELDLFNYIGLDIFSEFSHTRNSSFIQLQFRKN